MKTRDIKNIFMEVSNSVTLSQVFTSVLENTEPLHLSVRKKRQQQLYVRGEINMLLL